MYISPNNEFPRFYGDVQLANPGWELGDPLPEGWREVVEVERPEVGEFEVAISGFPEEIDGKLTQVWTVRPMTEEEIARKQAPVTAKEKLIQLGFSEAEIEVIGRGIFANR